jgi:hypothetical protein
MMGRTSDTRIYNPRSESSEMFRDNHEDERPPKGIEDGLDKEKRMDKKQAKKEQEENDEKSIKHIKVRRHHLGLKEGSSPDDEVEDEAGKKEADLEPHNQTMPSGAGGFLTSLATQAKGPGAASGEMIQMSEPMKDAWSELLKESDRGVARRRKKEMHSKWRPSTGQFEMPKGGSSPRSATSRRAKNISRNLPLGRKTGLMKPHLSVEFSHRGLASKQPMSKDPQKYRPYLASQHARKLLGNIRFTPSPHLAHSQRSYTAGPTGAGQLTGTLKYPRVPRPRLRPVRTPSIVPPKMKMPRLNRPKMPSMVTMSEDISIQSDILKISYYDKALLTHMVKEVRELMRLHKDRDSKKKGKGQPDVAGAASTLPNYAGNTPVSTTKPEGGTEDEDDARRWGLSPHDIVGRGSGRA